MITFLSSAIVVVIEVFPTILPVLSLTPKVVCGVFTFISLALCTANVALISDPANGLAVDINGSVYFGNLYYFSWASFLTSVWLTITYISSTTTIFIERDRENSRVNVVTEMLKSSQRMKEWVFLMVCSLIVMGASSSIYENQCIKTSTLRSSNFCGRTTLGIVLGCISTVTSLAIIISKISMAQTLFLFKIEAGCGALAFILYGFGVAFITGSAGPGAPLGNLYYFTWISFALSFYITSSCFEEYQAVNESQEEEDAVSQTVNVENQDTQQKYNMEVKNQIESEVFSSVNDTHASASFDDIPMEENYVNDK